MASLYDAQLITMERSILSGKTFTDLTIGFFGTSSAPFISDLYQAYFPYMNLLALFMILQRDLRMGQQFCLAFACLWFIGIVITYLWPTWGPCFFDPSIIAQLPKTRTAKVQELLWSAKLFRDAHPTSAAPYLIAGLPSLHVAVTILGSLYLGRISRILGIISWLFVMLTVISTLYFGWHYLIDDLAAIPLVLIALLCTKKMTLTHDIR